MSRFWKDGLVAMLAVAALGIVACQNNRAPAPTQQQGQVSAGEVTLRMGQTTTVENIPIRFIGVLGDSRCPSDVTCVWAGNAQVQLGIGPRTGTQGPTEQVLLNTSEADKGGAAWGLRLTLVDLTPAPRSTQPIPPENYVIRLKVEALER